MKILIFNWKDLAHPAAGGAEVYTERVAYELARRGHEVTLFVSAVSGCPERETVRGVRIVRAGSRFTVYREARRFWKREGEGAFDVLLDEVNTRPFMTPRYVRGVPIVALIHQVAREVWNYETPLPVALAGRYVFEPFWLRAYRDVLTLTDSPSSATSLRRYGMRSPRPVPMGGDAVPVLHAAKESVPTIVFLARLVRSKRPDHAVRAFADVRKAFPDAQMWMIGDGPFRPKLQRRVPAGVHLLGHVSNEERIARVARAHVLVATSVREGWGLNVSECAALGTPAIGYRVAGLIDSIPASGGVVVEPEPAALGRALVDYFAGRVELEPRISTVTWAEAADAVERALTEAVTTGNPIVHG